MAVSQSNRIQTVEEIVVLVTAAVFLKKPVSAIYNNQRRSLCPHVIGRSKNGDMQALCYQYAGGSASGLKAKGSPDNWRCLTLSRLRGVYLLEDGWRSAENHARPQTCIEEVFFDAEKPFTFQAPA